MSTAAYRHLENLPESVTGELFNGQLHAQSRPAFPHAYAHSLMGSRLSNPFHDGIGGPGGWIIIDEPEIHFKLDLDVAVPDLAGWRRARKLKFPTGHKIEGSLWIPDCFGVRRQSGAIWSNPSGAGSSRCSLGSRAFAPSAPR